MTDIVPCRHCGVLTATDAQYRKLGKPADMRPRRRREGRTCRPCGYARVGDTGASQVVNVCVTCNMPTVTDARYRELGEPADMRPRGKVIREKRCNQCRSETPGGRTPLRTVLPCARCDWDTVTRARHLELGEPDHLRPRRAGYPAICESCHGSRPGAPRKTYTRSDEALEMHEDLHMTYSQIADAMGILESTVERYIHRGRERRAELEES